MNLVEGETYANGRGERVGPVMICCCGCGLFVTASSSVCYFSDGRLADKGTLDPKGVLNLVGRWPAEARVAIACVDGCTEHRWVDTGMTRRWCGNPGCQAEQVLCGMQWQDRKGA